jgi:nucleoside-diphosphate-sugar epimerase
MNALVTGGAGFIGSHIVTGLLAQGAKVRVLDNFATGKRSNVTDIADQIELIEGDIRSYHIAREAVEGVDVIFHQAALPSVPRSIKDPITTHEVGVNGTLNILQAARDCGVARVIFASSSSIYGNNPVLPKHEELMPSPLSPYAVSKLTAEHYFQVFHKLYGLETVALRYFNVFGPRQDPTSQYSAVIPRFIQMMRRGERPTIYGDGEQSRDFTYVDNVVHANLLVASADTGVAGRVFNAACHDQITLNRLVASLNDALGTSIEPIYAEPRLGDVRHSFAAIDKLAATVGYEPLVDFNDGVRRAVQWYSTSTEPVATH